jgi:hypothetical protein
LKTLGATDSVAIYGENSAGYSRRILQWDSGNNELAIGQNGTVLFNRINLYPGTNGYVGISNASTFTPTAKLHVSATSSLDMFRVDNGGNAALIVASNSYVGIATNTPIYPLHIIGTTRTSNIQIDDTTGYISSGAGSNTKIYFENSGSMRFNTGGSEKVTIDSAGNVGIGITSSISNKLNIYATNNVIKIGDGGSGSKVAISLNERAWIGQDGGSGGLNLTAASTRPIIFGIGTDISPTTEWARFATTTGYFGIRTNNPLYPLTVVGTASFQNLVINNERIRLAGYTVSGLPSGTIGDLCYVTDALAPTFGSILTGGGAVVTMAFYNGSNWTSR